MSQLKRGDAKRAALLQAAAEVLVEKGLAAATTREIAERAASTERTLFKQFGSKEGLVSAVLDAVAAAQFESPLVVRLRQDPPRTLDAFEAWDREFIADRLTSPAGTDVGRLVVVELLMNPAFKARFSGPWRERLWEPLVGCLAALKAAGEVDADPAFLAHGFLSLHFGYLMGRLNLAPGADWDTERDAARLAAGFRRMAERR